MRIIQLLSTLLLLIGVAGKVHAHFPPGYAERAKKAAEKKATYRDICSNSVSAIDQEINNVRARLLGGGDCWWNFQDGRYVVPKVDVNSGQLEVSSIFAGSVWLGGVDPGNNLKLACMDFRTGTNNDFWPGPLTPEGITESMTCSNWDRHFRVTGEEIRQHLRNLASGNISPTAIPRGVKGWPAKGNSFFVDVWGFDLPETPQALALYFDANNDGTYNPLDGDYPSIEIRGCPLDRYPDEMIFWIYNDQGGGQPHNNTMGSAIQMEVQVQAFGYVTNDQLNDMTFQRYKLINRALESIDSTFFAMWVDPDLGCALDDYIGCDTARSLMYVYNQDASDGDPGCTCPPPATSNTYCDDIPILGVDYFRGPLDTTYIIADTLQDISGMDSLANFRDTFVEIGMSAFTYYNNAGFGNPPPGTTDPQTPFEFYNYLTGRWRDGTPFTFGDTGYNPGNPNAIPVNYAFTDPPDNPTGWSMCSENLQFGDRRTIQASGPFYLDPGEVNELIIGVPWVPSIDYPCPSLDALFRADQLAQALFDNCFDLLDGPDAPTVDWIELNQQLIAVLTNDSLSNNFKEAYTELDIFFPFPNSDSIPQDSAFYRFEGYVIYQLLNPNVSVADFTNSDLSRVVAQVDIRNGVSTIYNWEGSINPFNQEPLYTPVLKIEGADEGLRHTFSFTQDLFATGNERALINHKKYYYAAVAYAYNNYKQFDPMDPALGQQNSYLVGRRGTQIYTVIPRPVVDRVLQSSYGEGPEIVRLEGQGTTDGHFLDLTDETFNRLLTPDFDSVLVYKAGSGPFTINLFNPFEVKDGTYELKVVDENVNDNIVSQNATWELRQLPDGPVIASERTIEELNEQIVLEYGFTITLAQPLGEPGDRPNLGNGAIGGTVTFEDPNEQWLLAFADDIDTRLNYVKTDFTEIDENLDPDKRLSTLANGWFVPYVLADWRLFDQPDNIDFLITPAWTENETGGFGNNNNLVVGSTDQGRLDRLGELNNVDVVFTKDKSKWSRCIVVESASYYYTGSDGPVKDPDLVTESPSNRVRRSFDTRYALPVGKEDLNNDSLPDPDGAVDPVSGLPMYGMGWFPGYAVDVETGQRLNIFFGENSVYSKLVDTNYTGRDMLFNPTSEFLYDNFDVGVQYYNYMLGGQHMVYITNTPYDSCNALWRQLTPDLYNSNLQYIGRKRTGMRSIIWAGMFGVAPTFEMLTLNEGLIPNDVHVKLRVDNRFNVWWSEVGGGAAVFNGHPKYQFTIENRESYDIAQNKDIVNSALDSIKVVPNPYYGYSEYETSQFSNLVKITNLPGKCTVSIYSLDGKFIRQYKRDEVYQPYNQITPALEWDLRNNKGIPVASGVYLIHIDAPGLGRRTIKWFGVARQFDPSGL